MTSRSPNSLLEHGWKACGEGKLEQALQLFREVLEVCSSDEDPALRADIHVAIGKVERDLKQNEPAVSHYRVAAEIYRQLNDPMRLAHAIRHVADILRGMGRTEQAEPFIVEAICIYRQQLQSSEPAVGQQPIELHLANALRVASLLKEQAGLNSEALPLWVEARDLYRLAGVEAGVAESRAHLADAQEA